MQPASTVIVLFSGSTARTRFMRERFTITWRPEPSGMPPPQRLVLPPCGTIGTPALASNATTRATSPVLAGFTIAAARPRK
jgi:hypothetical protein